MPTKPMATRAAGPVPLVATFPSMCKSFAADKMNGSEGMMGTPQDEETNEQQSNSGASYSMGVSSASDTFSVAERALLQRLLVEGNNPGAQQGAGDATSSSYMPPTQRVEGLFSNSMSFQTGTNNLAEQNATAGNSLLGSYQNINDYQPDQSMNHAQPHQNLNAYQFNESMDSTQQLYQSMSAYQHAYPSQQYMSTNAYQPLNHHAAAMMPQPQRQHQSSHNGLDLALSRYGYANPSSLPLSSVLTELNSLPNDGTTQAAATHVAQANMAFGTYDQSSALPYQQSDVPPATATTGQQGLINYFQGTGSVNDTTTTTEDWMSAQQQSASLHNFGPAIGAPMASYDGSSLSHQFAGAAPLFAHSNPQSIASSNLPSHPASASSSIPSRSPMSASSPQVQPAQEHNWILPTRLMVPSDSTFLDPVHNFIRSICIELFLSKKEHMTCAGRGARASKVGQVGLRCSYCKNVPHQELTRQAICYPSKRDTIFESVRNYQRVHLDDCPCIPQEVKDKYKKLIEKDFPSKKSQRFLKAYYTEAAKELGLVDAPKGLIFGSPPNTSGTPSKSLEAVIRAAQSPANASKFWKEYNDASSKEKAKDLRKFDNLASERTREVLRNARKEVSPFVLPQDYPTISDVEFLLYKQVHPCRPSANTLKRRGIDPESLELKGLAGLCCKHCARAHQGENHHNGMYFPMNLAALADSSFSQSLLNHMTGCRNVPQEIKDSFVELKHLASEHGIVTKRGSKKKFLEKIWERMKNYYA